MHEKESQASCFQGEESHVTPGQSICSPRFDKQLTTTSRRLARNLPSLPRPLAHSRAASPSALCRSSETKTPIRSKIHSRRHTIYRKARASLLRRSLNRWIGIAVKSPLSYLSRLIHLPAPPAFGVGEAPESAPLVSRARSSTT